jgi:uncharacterized membrane protein YgcG
MSKPMIIVTLALYLICIAMGAILVLVTPKSGAHVVDNNAVLLQRTQERLKTTQEKLERCDNILRQGWYR